MEKNYITQARPTSSFDAFEKSNKSLTVAFETMKNLAAEICQKSETILNENYPFDNARLLILHGKAGRGKTHLAEALINHIKEKQPSLLTHIFLSRTNFTHDNMAFACKYNGCPIIIIDDIEELHPRTDIEAIMNFIKMIYEKRCLVIITSNFPIKGKILKKIKEIDKVGRIASRLKELLSYSGELELKGDDYRDKIAQKNNSQFLEI